MPGVLCNGEPLDSPLVKESKAYCDGREAAWRGELKATNPHTAGGRDATLWDNGWDSYNGGVGTPTQDCCAIPAYSGP